MSDPIVELRSLTKTYGQMQAVDNINLTIQPGEFLTLLGPSGCGKTSTLRMIAGFEEPTAGEVFLDGRNVTDDPPYNRPVNTVFQDYALFPHMTVAQNIGFGLSVARVPKSEIKSRVEEMLEVVGLSSKAAQKPAALSGGQKQRVALARALVRHPQVLLLDEPLSALDAHLRQQMQVELKQLQLRVGITFILVTHDQNEALVLSDRIVVMNKGKIIQTGTPEAIYDEPQSAFVAGFLGSTNLMPASLLGGPSGQIASVRPERVWLGVDQAACPNDAIRIRGQVSTVAFHGNGFRVAIELGGGQIFLVDLPRSAEIPEAGSASNIIIPNSAIQVFSNTDNGE